MRKKENRQKREREKRKWGSRGGEMLYTTLLVFLYFSRCLPLLWMMRMLLLLLLLLLVMLSLHHELDLGLRLILCQRWDMLMKLWLS